MEISKSAVIDICQWLDNKGYPVLADELYVSPVRTEFRYLLSLYKSDRLKFILPTERVVIYKNDKARPTVLWYLNSKWQKNLFDYQDVGKVTEQLISSNFRHFVE